MLENFFHFFLHFHSPDNVFVRARSQHRNLLFDLLKVIARFNFDDFDSCQLACLNVFALKNKVWAQPLKINGKPKSSLLLAL